MMHELRWRRFALTAISLCMSMAVCMAHEAAIDLTRLPLGDGRISSAPKVGWIWACRTDPDAGGAFRAGPWIHGDTYDLTAKAVVPGDVRWPHAMRITPRGDFRQFESNDLPLHGTGIFPIPVDSEAFNYDRNPNSIATQNMLLQLPRSPAIASQPSCAPGAVGILLSGSVLFSALDAPGRDAVAHETQDSCQGHPQVSGVYHYHSVSECVDNKRLADGHSALVGYAIDGFGIYGHYGEGGAALRSTDLDECHGHTHAIQWDGKTVAMYHYHATWDFPYTVGCLRGKYSMRDVMTISGPPPQGQPRMPGGDQRESAPTDRRGQDGRMPPLESGGDDRMSPPAEGQGDRPPMGRHPDLRIAARKLGISKDRLRRALGPPPPNLDAAAQTLGIDVQTLRSALSVP